MLAKPPCLPRMRLEWCPPRAPPRVAADILPAGQSPAPDAPLPSALRIYGTFVLSTLLNRILFYIAHRTVGTQRLLPPRAAACRRVPPRAAACRPRTFSARR